MATTIAVWAAFTKRFPQCDMIDGDDDDLENDVNDALRDLGQLGFFAGYFVAQTLFAVPLYAPLAIGLGIEYDRLNEHSGVATLVVVMAWAFGTKMRDYARASARVSCEIRSTEACPYAGIA